MRREEGKAEGHRIGGRGKKKEGGSGKWEEEGRKKRRRSGE